MSTERLTDPLAAALFGETRRAVLGLLLSRPTESFYVREIVRAVRGGPGAVQRELTRLERAGIVRRCTRGRQVFFQADSDCPVYPELRGLVLKTVGAAGVLRAALAGLAARITVAFIYGSLARGDPRRESDVDVCVVGAVTFAEVVVGLRTAQAELNREINPTVYTAEEFARKLGAGHHFVSAVVAGPKVFLIGGPRELERVGQKRLGGAASDHLAGDQRATGRHRTRSR